MAKKAQFAVVRGMTAQWFMDHFKEMKVYFGGVRGKPSYDVDFVGFYLEAPVSAVTHFGVVERIERNPDETVFHLKAIIKLDKPVKVTDHPVRKAEYWPLDRLGIGKFALLINDFARVGGSN